MPDRFVRMLSPHLIRLTVGPKSDDYAVAFLPQAMGSGCRGFHLVKLTGPVEEDEPPAYDVLLGNGQDVHDSCQCKGHLRWHGTPNSQGRACKHIDGLKALIRAGKL
jgi:hypothetical protein